MARICMLESVIMRWADTPGGTVMNHCPEIGAEVDVPDDVVATLKREWFTRVQPEGEVPDGPYPEPHLAKRVQPARRNSRAH